MTQIDIAELTDEQIKHWRTVLCGMVGPYALLMTREEIQAFRDKMQKKAGEIDEKESQCPPQT